VLVDGRRVNEIDLSGVDWTQIPLDQVERIEIVRGSGSVLYGDNAAGGVVNIITKRPEKPFSAGGEVAIGSYHYHKESVRSVESGAPYPPSSVRLQFYRWVSENQFLRAKNVGGKIIYDLNETLSFNLSGGFHQDDTGLPGALSKTIYESDRRSAKNPFDKAETKDGFGLFGIKANLGKLAGSKPIFHTAPGGKRFLFPTPLIVKET